MGVPHVHPSVPHASTTHPVASAGWSLDVSNTSKPPSNFPGTRFRAALMRLGRASRDSESAADRHSATLRGRRVTRSQARSSSRAAPVKVRASGLQGGWRRGIPLATKYPRGRRTAHRSPSKKGTSSRKSDFLVMDCARGGSGPSACGTRRRAGPGSAAPGRVEAQMLRSPAPGGFRTSRYSLSSIDGTRLYEHSRPIHSRYFSASARAPRAARDPLV